METTAAEARSTAATSAVRRDASTPALTRLAGRVGTAGGAVEELAPVCADAGGVSRHATSARASASALALARDGMPLLLARSA